MSAVCEAFACTPAEALAQDWGLVQAILDYRAALAARDAFNHKDKAQGFEVLTRNPRLLEVLAMMSRAQRGESLTRNLDARREGAAVAAEYRREPEGPALGRG